MQMKNVRNISCDEDVVLVWFGLQRQNLASAKPCGVEQRAPPTLGRATITLGIGPHFQLTSFSHCRYMLRESSQYLPCDKIPL